jgi:hypothetical protein
MKAEKERRFTDWRGREEEMGTEPNQTTAVKCAPKKMYAQKPIFYDLGKF